ncbi:coxsackievirus and adenovirus receptor isoform X2 [Tiliqua scincoides]|uniref:coxsackievirus and adenovirus receptor isoform X2 n=1 Tax=Tiliqua scincoides TaxID=71010 RepID=UPI003462A6A1
MESSRLLWLLPLLGSVLLSSDPSECVMISPTDQTIVTKAQGEKVTLICKFTLASEDVGQLDIEWVMVQPDSEQTVILYNTGKTYDTYHMSGRVGFVDPAPSLGDGTIEILNLKPTDTGTYQCKVKKLPGIDTHRVQLTVLEKPSRTKCYIQGSQEIGTDVTLKCTSQEGSPVITYNWIKTTDTDQLPPTSVLNTDTGDLLMKNASQIYSGSYKCVSSNRVGTDECSVVLNITPPMNRAGTIAGAIIGTLLGLSLLAFFIFCCCKKQREKKYEKEVHHDIREDVPPPKSRASTARSYIGSNRSSLGSMSPSNMDGYAKTQYNKVPSEDFERTPAQNPNFQPPKYDHACRMGDIAVV